MISFPSAFEERIKNILQEEAGQLFDALQQESPVSVRLNPAKTGMAAAPLLADVKGEPVAWCETGFYLKERPVFTLDPCFHGGAYYVQEASSMFLHHVLKQVMPTGDLRVLDLCAAPGGKSTLIASLLSPGSLLIANEVIRSRASVLKENIIKWGHDNIVVTSSDPVEFTPLQGAFDIVVVDAPCSGEGMFRKEAKAVGEWSENNLQLCSDRQKRILANVWDTLKPDGVLIYSTCTYNPGENEEILEWMTKELDAELVPVRHPFDGIVNTTGCRFYPHRITGEGFFIGVVRKKEGTTWQPPRGKRSNKPQSTAVPAEIARLIRPEIPVTAYVNGNQTGIIPAAHEAFIDQLEKQARVVYKGCEVAKINNKKLKLLHPLALYNGLNRANCTVFEANRETALTYLKKEDIPVTAPAGEWVLITHNGIGLGWGKSLGNRLNNYFPKEWRIRMQVH